MPTTYKRADNTAEGCRDRMMEKFHPDLFKLAVNVDLLFAWNDDPEKPAVTLGGYPCYAKVRIVGLKDRTLGHGDAEIIIDEAKWFRLSPAERDALMDHELTHLDLKRDPETYTPMRDALNRPRLTMVKHDYQFGWFTNVVKRHGLSSIEAKQANDLMKTDGQLYFGFADQKPPMKLATA
jgi:hypothetical protein